MSIILICYMSITNFPSDIHPKQLRTRCIFRTQYHLNCVASHTTKTLHWRHNDHGGVSNHQPHDCLLNRLFRRRSKKAPNLHVTDLCVGNSSGPVISPHKGPVTRKMFPFDDVIMIHHVNINSIAVNSNIHTYWFHIKILMQKSCVLII